MGVPALHGLREARHAPLGKTRLQGHASHALLAVFTKTLENPYAFGR